MDMVEGNMWTRERGICGHGREEYMDMGQGNLKEPVQNCFFRSIIIGMGVQYRELQLVVAPHYKPEGHGFDFR